MVEYSKKLSGWLLVALYYWCVWLYEFILCISEIISLSPRTKLCLFFFYHYLFNIKSGWFIIGDDVLKNNIITRHCQLFIIEVDGRGSCCSKTAHWSFDSIDWRKLSHICCYDYFCLYHPLIGIIFFCSYKLNCLYFDILLKW